MMLSDGQKEMTNEKCNREDLLPTNIRQIDVFLRAGERAIHSMIFYGDTTLKIGFTPETDMKLSRSGYHHDVKGRRDTFLVPEGEKLIGCTMICNEEQFMMAI